MLCFHLYEQIDYDADMTQVIETLEGNEQILYEALLKRGASFLPALSGTLGGESPHETLMELSVKGLVHADSFAPVRHLLSREKIKRAPVKQRVRAPCHNDAIRPLGDYPPAAAAHRRAALGARL